jgi:hypothetical protein
MTGGMPRPPARKISISVSRRVWFCAALRPWVVDKSVDMFVFVCVHTRLFVSERECVWLPPTVYPQGVWNGRRSQFVLADTSC